ncbi:hypothetical protein OESDEN_02371 [Oesophagostomum dentatum]|uniref:Serpin domain-containing protein n=1 Tax=Oesophagostomum dentatum TaxID=61180 RepID=A0A0B1TNL3_OESDE|nr:hypothetical protein OESDEN_02371 [Oesophagostomum dentatum]
MLKTMKSRKGRISPISICFFLKNCNRFGLNELLMKIDGTRIQNLLSRLNKWFSISIKIPKMKLETDFNLKEALISMGITDLFSGNADLTGITESNQNLMVSGASHKAIIEVSGC